MLQAAKGIPAWREPLTVPLIVATGLAEGGGLWLLLAAASGPGIAVAVAGLRAGAAGALGAVAGLAPPPARGAARAGGDRPRRPGLQGRHAAAAGRRRCWPLSSPLPPAALIALQALAGALAAGRRAVVQVHAGHARRLQPGLCADAAAGARRAAQPAAATESDHGRHRREHVSFEPPRPARPAPGAGDDVARRTRRAAARAPARGAAQRLRRTCPGSARGWTPRACTRMRCADLDDLQRLPFMVKTDLRDHYPFGLFARPVDALARVHASSGTTGPAHGGRLHRRRPATAGPT